MNRRAWVTFGASAVVAVGCLGILDAPAAGAATKAHGRTVTGGWSIPDTKVSSGAVLTTSAAKVCTKGYASSVRNVSTATKNTVYAEYGITAHVAYQYEIDHDISLELGGSNDIKNLWPEPNDRKTSNTKDVLENKLHTLVCNHTISLKTAQTAIRGDWTKAYQKYIGALGTYTTYPRGGGSSSSKGSSGSGSTGALDPRFSTCAAAKAAGYGPYYRGKDPEYAWYRDADGDGIVCE